MGTAKKELAWTAWYNSNSFITSENGGHHSREKQKHKREKHVTDVTHHFAGFVAYFVVENPYENSYDDVHRKPNLRQ